MSQKFSPPFQRHARRLALAAVIASLAACASTPQVSAQWTDPQLPVQSQLLRGARVLVACEAADLAVRQVCQDRLAAEVVARGSTPVAVAANTTLAIDRPLDAQLLPVARSANAKAVLVLSIAAGLSDVSPGVSIGLGGFSFGRGGGGGVGISAPIGGGRVMTGYSANGRVTEVAGGRLLWTASAAAAPSAGLDAQFTALAKAVLDSAEKAGLF